MIAERFKTRLAGALAALPLIPGIAAGGVLYGAASIDAGVEPLTVMLTSLLVATGTAQFIALDLLSQGIPWLLIVLVGLLVNLRFAVYSVHLADMPSELPRWRRWLYYGLITDEGYALSLARRESTEEDPIDLLRWSVPLMVLVWLAWLFGTGVGAILGSALPSSRWLDMAVPLTLLSVLVLITSTLRHLLVAGGAGLVALVLHGAPFGLGLILAIAGGVGLGVALHQKQAPPPPECLGAEST